MGRAPCCDKANVKKGPWSPEEDAKLKSYIEQHGTGGNWIALPQKIGLKRCGKSCRLRWLNYLRPNIKHGGFSEEEDNLICSLYISIGSRWSIIAAQLPGRTDNDIKNYWNTRLKKKLLGKQRKEHQATRRGGAGSCQKQGNGSRNIVNGPGNENENENVNFMVPQYQSLPYWPVPTIPYSNEEARLSDHASIRKLLMKLGGRFCDEGQEDKTTLVSEEDRVLNLQFPMEVSSQPLYDGLGIMDRAAAGGSADGQFGHNMGGSNTTTTATDFQQGQMSNYQVEHQLEEEMVYSNPVGGRLDGLEFLCGGDHDLNMRSWSEMTSSLMISPSSYEPTAGIIQEAAFDDGLRYSPVAPGTRLQ